MKYYHDLYLKSDVLSLAKVLSLKNYGLCPSDYLSVICLRWDAMLKMTKIELELITDPDMYIFSEKCTRDGIFIRWSKAKDNLFGYAMPKFFPTSEVKWINPKVFDLNKYFSSSSEGCILEVDS